jgi:hypothetical protein
MTSETKRFIEIPDIIGLRLKCGDCKCSLLIDVEQEKGPINNLMAASNATLLKCPTCGKEWTPFKDRGDAWDSPVKEFLRSMRFLRQIENTLGYTLALEIRDEKKP